MATLSGNKIKNTYQSLVKFSDNGNITTSAKQLTDGFGNNSPMFVSTTQVGIGVTPESGLNLHVFGDAKIGSNLTVIGNLVVEGSTTTVGTDTLTVKDPLIVLANNNTSTDAVDIGFYGKYTPAGTTLYSGIFREALTGKYRLFKGLEVEPTTTVNTSGTGYAVATLIASLEGNVLGNLTGNVTGGSISGTTGDFSGNVDIDGTLDVDDVISVEGSAFGRIEIGGASGGYIDLKAPNSDDYDLRIITSSGGNEITTATGDLIFNTAETLALTIDTSQDVTFEGNIIVSGTVDGRDVSVDGAKLDGIESGATADQTAAEIKTAYESNSNTNAFTDADVTKLNGIEASADVTDATNVLAAGAVMTSGNQSIAGDKTFSDQISISGDLTVNTSTLKVDSTNSQVGINNASPSGFTSDANDLIIGDGTSDRGMTIYSSNQAYGHIFFNDAETGSSTNGGFISYTHNGDAFEIGVAGNGLGAGSLTISETSVYTKENLVVDASFTSVYNTLTVDASSGKLGIRNNAPTYPLDVNGDARITGLTYLSSDLTVGTDSLFVDVSTDSVGIGLTNPSAYSADTLVINTPDEKGITLVSSSTEKAYIAFQDGTGALENFMSFDHASSKMNFNVFDTAGDISFSLGEGVEKLTVDNTNVRVLNDLTVDGNSTFSGNVGIGQTSTTNALNLYKNASQGNPSSHTPTNATLKIEDSGNTMYLDGNSIITTGTSAFTMGNTAAADLIMYTNAVERMRITSGGALEIKGSSTNANSSAFITNDNNITIIGSSTSGSVTKDMSFHTGAERMRIDSSGNVGIGTTSPDVKLQIINSDSTQNILSLANQNSATHAFDFGRVVSTGALSIQGRQTGYNNILLAPTSGNVGIGTTSPSGKLNVFGATGLPATSGTTFTGTMRLQVAGYGTTLDFGAEGPSTGKQWMQATDASNLAITYPLLLNPNGGNVGIGTTSPSEKLEVAGNVGVNGFITHNGDSGTFMGWSANDTNVFYTAGNERMRITSGGIFQVGKTDSDSNTNGFAVFPTGAGGGSLTNCYNGGSGDALRVGRNGTGSIVSFVSVTTGVGSISVTASSTSYNTSSDYRLKENVVEITGALDRVSQLKPSRFNFIADADKTVDGFLAHEVQEIVPEAITGEKDAMRTEEYEVSPAVYEDVVHPAEEAVYETIEHPAVEEELDDEGNIIVEGKEAYTEEVLVTEAKEEWTEKVLVSEKVMGTREVPDYQGIDQSKLVPLLVGAIQELKAEIESLKLQINN